MAEPRDDIYARLIQLYVARGVINRHDRIFVQFAGSFDERICAQAGLTNCTFGNIAPGSTSTGDTSAQQFDAHRMPQDDGSFDHVFAHAGLHHCSRPHEALHEMYRLATTSVLFIENQDSLAMRAASALGVLNWYELNAVADGDFETGGVDGTGIPNYVYRWTRREVRKAVACFDPAVAVPIEFHSEWNVGSGRESSQTLARKLRLRPHQAERLLEVSHRALNSVASQQGNIFAAMILKGRATLMPWMGSRTSMRRAN